MTSALTSQRIIRLAGTLLATLAALLCLQLSIGRAHAQTATKAGGHLAIALKNFTLSGSNVKQRLTVGCPGRTLPLGGGMTADPPPGHDGGGIYPHSYERLGVQHGWHVTVVAYDPSGTDTDPYQVTLQAICAPRVKHVTPPHRTVWVAPGQTQSAVATCPGRRQLFAGGFQRTDFTSRGGDFVTESRAISSKSWRVTGHAFGGFGGQLTAIAYCWRSKKPLLTEVSGSVPVQPNSYSTAISAPCPPGLRMTSGGFSTNGSTSMFFTDGILHLPGVWNSSAYNSGTGPPGTLTSYGYCLKV
jgi:hypothetical protein